MINLDEENMAFLKDLALAIEKIDNHCAHCIDGFLNHGDMDYDTMELDGGLNAIMQKYFPGWKFVLHRGKGLERPIVTLEQA